MLDVAIGATHDHLGYLERLARIKRGAHFEAGGLQRRILGVVQQGRHHLLTDPGVGCPYDGISRSPSIEDASVPVLDSARMTQHFGSEETVESAALMGRN